MARDYSKNRRDNHITKRDTRRDAHGDRDTGTYTRGTSARSAKGASSRSTAATAKSSHSHSDSHAAYREKKERSPRTQRPQRAEQQPFDEEALPEGIIAGRNPVMEALKSGRDMTKLLVADGAEGSIKKIIGMAREKNIIVQYVDKNALSRATGGMPHQGVVAYVSDFEYCEPEDILARAAEKGEAPFIIILDGVEDTHNLGAIIRTSDAAGAHGVIIPKRRAAAVTAVAEKAAAGATAYVPVARVANIGQTIDMLKDAGVWTVATDMDGERLFDADLAGAVALVIGSEGRGISRLVKEKCDICVSMPMRGGVNSLNASNAAAILMYEIVRQRGL